MSDPINLNRVRKERARTEGKAEADINSVKFGRSKAERILAETRTAQASKMLDRHNLTGED